MTSEICRLRRREIKSSFLIVVAIPTKISVGYVESDSGRYLYNESNHCSVVVLRFIPRSDVAGTFPRDAIRGNT